MTPKATSSGATTPTTPRATPSEQAEREHLAACRSRQEGRSGKLAPHEPAGLAAAPAGGLLDALEPVCLEELDGAHVTASLVDALAARVDRVAFQRGRALRV